MAASQDKQTQLSGVFADAVMARMMPELAKLMAQLGAVEARLDALENAISSGGAAGGERVAPKKAVRTAAAAAAVEGGAAEAKVATKPNITAFFSRLLAENVDGWRTLYDTPVNVQLAKDNNATFAKLKKEDNEKEWYRKFGGALWRVKGFISDSTKKELTSLQKAWLQNQQRNDAEPQLELETED